MEQLRQKKAISSTTVEILTPLWSIPRVTTPSAIYNSRNFNSFMEVEVSKRITASTTVEILTPLWSPVCKNGQI